MRFESFNRSNFDATKEPMFFGRGINIARYDKQKYPIFEKLTEQQLSFFWRPEEVDVTKDRRDFATLPEHEKHIFTSNLKYQILLDSVQGRSPVVAFLPVTSLPEMEVWIGTWNFMELIHSRSYTHIIRNIFNDPSEVFDEIMDIPEILERAESIGKHYDEFIKLSQIRAIHGTGKIVIDGIGYDTSDANLMRKLYLTLISVNILEGIRFYLSFACSFNFAERKLMEGNAKIIRSISRDEAVHLAAITHILKIIHSGKEGEEFKRIAEECREEAISLFKVAAEQEKAWCKYLFKDGSMIGLNEQIACNYVEYLTNQRMASLGFDKLFDVNKNPLPWMNNWLSSSNVQVAPQETEISSYLVGQIDSEIDDSLGSFSL